MYCINSLRKLKKQSESVYAMKDDNKSLKNIPQWSVFVICFSIMLFVTVGFSLANNMIDKDQAWEIVKKECLGGVLIDKVVYISHEPLNAGEEIRSWNRTYKVPNELEQVWLFFIDDQPEANWEHSCRYIFVDTKNGKYHIIKACAPPENMDRMKKVFPEE